MIAKQSEGEKMTIKVFGQGFNKTAVVMNKIEKIYLNGADLTIYLSSCQNVFVNSDSEEEALNIFNSLVYDSELDKHKMEIIQENPVVTVKKERKKK